MLPASKEEEEMALPFKRGILKYRPSYLNDLADL
jgi:hypothetical protein